MIRIRAVIASLFVPLALLCPAAQAAPAATPAYSFTQPALSPDGSEIAFVSNGRIWSVAAGGGDAHLLVAGEGTQSRPLYSPNGKRLAFVSDKAGSNDIYVLDLASGELRRLTYDDGSENLDAWSADGRWLYFTTSRDNVGGMGGSYRISASGGTPMPVALEAYRNEESAAPSPDGKTLALVGEGWGSTQWWRHGRAHIDESAIWLLANDGSHRYTRITPDNARALWPMWAADGRTLYYMSDRSGTENLWQVRRDGSTEAAITHFTDGRVLWPTISADGRRIAFERGFGIWTLDTATGRSRPVAIRLRGVAGGPDVRHETFAAHFSGLAVSPDGRKLAFIVHGEVFAAPAKGGDDKDAPKAGGPAKQVTHTPGAEFGLAWAPDSRRVVYSSERDGTNHLFLYDFRSSKETRLTDGAGNDAHPAFSPDGDKLAFVRDGHSLYVLDIDSGKATKLASGNIDLRHPLGSERPLAWSPDGRWIAYLDWGQRMYRGAMVVPAAGGRARPVSFLGNTFADSINWSPHGQSLLFATGQRTEVGQVARVNLVPKTPKFREERFHDLFKEETPPAVPTPTRESEPAPPAAERAPTAQQPEKKKSAPVRIDFAHIRERLSLLPIGLDVLAATVSPDGKQLLLIAEVAGRSNLYVWSLDELADTPPVARQLTSTPGDKSAAQYAPDGKTVYYLDDGKIFSVAVGKGEPEAISASAEMDVDFDAEKHAAFVEAWHWLKNDFHDPRMNGVDWQAVRDEYAPRVAAARTPDAVHDLLNRMVGELNASHSGVRPGQHPAHITGRLGLQFDRAAYEQHGRFRISRVMPLSPADVSGRIKVGDYLLAIDGEKLSAGSNISQLLAHRIGDETTLTIADSANGKSREVRVKPIDASGEAELAYDAWVEHNRRYVSQLSGGRLGYVHLADMSLHSLQRFYKELDAQNATRDGVVIDVRNNFGGFVNAYALDVLTRRPYLTMTFRGMQPAAARPVLGQHALERPTVLITNRVTLSDGEDFTRGYRAMHIGKVVGEPTAGWIIYTSNVKLIDGAVVRLPFITVTTTDGKPMEQHPRPVDVPVAEPLGESYRGKDARLEAAVRTLLGQIK